MKYIRKAKIVNAVQYKPGMEDGITPIANERGEVEMRPYLIVGLSRRYMNPTDYIVGDQKRRLSVMTEKYFLRNYEPFDKIIEEIKVFTKRRPKHYD